MLRLHLAMEMCTISIIAPNRVLTSKTHFTDREVGGDGRQHCPNCLDFVMHPISARYHDHLRLYRLFTPNLGAIVDIQLINSP